MQDQAQRFKSLVRQLMGGRQGRGVRYPQAVREEAVSLAHAELASGASLADIAAALGIGEMTLSRWLEPARVGLREVEILAAEPAARLAARPASAGFVLVSPSGLRVEGLELPQVAELLRALG